MDDRLALQVLRRSNPAAPARELREEGLAKNWW